MVLLLIGGRNRLSSRTRAFPGAPRMPACVTREIVREEASHGWSRCCRRVHLLGMDPLTGKDHNHRRQWVVERLQLLVASFVVDVCFPWTSTSGCSTGAAVRFAGTSGSDSGRLEPILERLGVVEDELVESVRQFPRCFRRLAGWVSHFTARAARSAAA